MIPNTIQAGLTAEWTVTLPDEFAGYSFQYVLQGPDKVIIPGVVSGSDIDFNVSSQTTLDWLPGDYRFQLIASKAANRKMVHCGALVIAPDFENLLAGHDFRNHEEIVLDIIKKALENRLSKDEQSYEIDGRSVVRIPILELQQLRRTYQRLIHNQARKKAGKSIFRPKTVRVKFAQ